MFSDAFIILMLRTCFTRFFTQVRADIEGLMNKDADKGPTLVRYVFEVRQQQWYTTALEISGVGRLWLYFCTKHELYWYFILLLQAFERGVTRGQIR